MDLEVKHRQLARYVRVFIEHPPENLMLSFNFTNATPDEGIMFTFSSGGFNNHLANPRSRRHLLRHPAATSPILPMISAGSNFLI
jgi:hypothetical protein